MRILAREVFDDRPVDLGEAADVWVGVGAKQAEHPQCLIGYDHAACAEKLGICSR